MSSALLHALSDTDDESYALCCEALAAYDARAELDEVTIPVLALAGEHDPVAPPATVAAMAAKIPRGTSVTVAGAGHLASAERPAQVATLLADFFTKGPIS